MATDFGSMGFMRGGDCSWGLVWGSVVVQGSDALGVKGFGKDQQKMFTYFFT